MSVHVGLIVPSYGASELQIPALSLLVDGLAARADVTVLPLRNPASVPVDDDQAATLLDFSGAGLPFRTILHRSVGSLRERHRQRPFDLLHGYWLFEPGLVAIAAARVLSIPSIVSIGGAELSNLAAIGYGGLRSTRGRLVSCAAMGTATLVTGGSEYVLDLASRHVPGNARKLRRVPLPVRTNEAAKPPENPYSHAGLRLLQVGAYLPVKGQDLAIRALATLVRERDDISLTLIGENPHGYRERMLGLARALRVDRHVHLLERIPHTALAGYYQHADLLLLPSRHESQGMVVLEAAAHGLPTLGARVGVVGDLAPEAAFAVPADDLGALIGALRHILTDRDLRHRVGATARQVVTSEYSVEPVIQRWLDAYGEARYGY